MRLANLLRELRETKGISIRQAAAEAHLSFGSLSKYETGRAFPGEAAAASLAKLYGVEAIVLQAAAAIDRRRIDVPDGVDENVIAAALYELTGKARA